LNRQIDAFRLEQVFRNILDNSLAECADRPEVEIQILSSAARLEGREAIRIAVHDNGPGLTAEQRQRIFDSFYTKKIRATGSGMAIVKRIIEAHGVRAWVSDSSGPGAEIHLISPRHQGRRDHGPPSPD
jgi:signal transduction histidine kinase